MKDWTYHWVEHLFLAQDQTERMLDLPFMYIYVRSFWERHLDGMNVPRTEILGYVQYNQASKLWESYLHKDTITSFESKGNHLSAMLIIENFIQQNLLKS